jgi:hypothetical protein
MPIKILLTKDGNIEINSLEQADFSIEKDGMLLVLPFSTIEKGSHNIVIEATDDINKIIEYLIDELKKSKFNFILDHDLNLYWNSYCKEKAKIDNVKTKKLKNKLLNLDNIFKDDRKPLQHQIKAIKHALLIENPANFSVPGSGKTQSALGCFIKWKHNKLIEKAIVIGPASCFKPWEDEANICLNKKLNIVRWSGSTSKRIKLSKKIKDADFILVTYQTACNDNAILEQLLRRYKILLIIDESHYIKNPNGMRFQKIKKLSSFASKRMILTGTPAPYSLTDLWSQFTFLWPSQQLLSNFFIYKNELDNQNNPLEKLKRELSPFFIRTTKKQLGLPAIKRKIIMIKNKNIPFEQKKIIELLELRTMQEARRYNLTYEDLDTLRKWRTARIIRLLQATSNPGLLLKKLNDFSIDNSLDIDTNDLIKFARVFLNKEKLSAKIDTVIKLTKILIESNKKVIIWTWFVENIKLLLQLLKEYDPMPLFGEIKPYENKDDSAEEQSRERNINLFKKSENKPILIANPSACAESISLHKVCQNAIYLDRNFNCGQFMQSMDRIHRVGMPKGLTATYYIPVINCAIERVVNTRLKERQRIMYNFLNDSMQVLGIEDDMWIADSESELDSAFDDIIKEIENEKKK